MIKTYKPTSPARRFLTRAKSVVLSKKRPEKRLTRPIHSSGGRNSQGRVTVRHRGGGHKRHYRIIDFKRDKDGIPATVEALEYDPNRSAHLALLRYEDGEKRYILAVAGLKDGDRVMSGPDAGFSIGNALPLEAIPIGMTLHNIELARGGGGKLARSAGASCELVSKEEGYAGLKMPSGEIRRVGWECRATIGQIGNIDHENQRFGSAGARRHTGRRSRVRGTAMNAVDHPHGGGKGKSKGANVPSTPWGKPTRGVRTRDKKKSTRMIIKPRPRGKRKGGAG